MQDLVQRICLSFCHTGISPPVRSDINISELTGFISFEVYIVTVFHRFGLSNFPASNCRTSIADKAVVNGSRDSKQWGVGGQPQNFPRAFPDSSYRKCGTQSPSQCD